MRCVSICLIRIRKGQAQEAMLQVINASGPQAGTGVSKARENAQDSCDYVLHVQGMMCGHCEARVKKALEAAEGIERAKADHTTGEVHIIQTAEIPEEVFKAIIGKAGYTYKGMQKKRIA